MPANIDPLTVKSGLAAQSSLSPTAVAVAVPALVGRVLGDGLAGARVAGLYAGILLVAAVWLLGAEIFRRTPTRGAYGSTIEDDGRLAKMLATAIAAFGLPVLFYARAPVILEGLAWGSLGLWALLYGLRTGILPVIGASALLMGASAYYGPNGLALSWRCSLPVDWIDGIGTTQVATAC